MKCTHIRLIVDNYKECFLFYRDVLGFAVTWGNESSLYGQFEIGDIQLGVFERKQMEEAVGTEFSREVQQMNRAALIFKVDSVEDTYNQLNGKVEFVTQPKEQVGWGLKVAHFRDPDGSLIEIYENL
ncbi:glyoxalase/bleomycin resistance/extradiol dioxygenase family protein [Halalkalibacter krulwichiae]|uniref:Glyoxalase-like domain protein n=1 Tax=Halalkalibacter krulwichiae TaxID=199441 RepID=A0A1X9MB08_9BACI|nr:glyoxalase/bleomycin resistance/extradiol dioxygenase family protein [Halalkalibacter krulwichiae]ARK29770.1 Glyoxalase-like domain protein [Halalkalibacter krulwichiae]